MNQYWLEAYASSGLFSRRGGARLMKYPREARGRASTFLPAQRSRSSRIAVGLSTCARTATGIHTTATELGSERLILTGWWSGLTKRPVPSGRIVLLGASLPFRGVAAGFRQGSARLKPAIIAAARARINKFAFGCGLSSIGMCVGEGPGRTARPKVSLGSTTDESERLARSVERSPLSHGPEVSTASRHHATALVTIARGRSTSCGLVGYRLVIASRMGVRRGT